MMYGYIEVEKSDNDFTKQKWSFSLDDRDLSLSLRQYVIYQRETKRHKFSVVQLYNYLTQRDNTIKREDVPLPEDVIEAAIAKVRDMIHYRAT